MEEKSSMKVSLGRCELPRLLVTANLEILRNCYDDLARNFECIFAYGSDLNEVKNLLSDQRAWFCSPCPEYYIDHEILCSAESLEILVTPSTGITHIAKEYCDKQNIYIATLKDSDVVNNIYASSEYTFALILAASRNLVPAVNGARRGEWRENEGEYRGVELNGKTLGVIGYGRIGSNVARYARSFGMKVIAFDPYVQINRKDEVDQAQNILDVLQTADVIVTCVHLTDSTKEMMNRKTFSKIKNGAIFVNTSRGEVVDEAALVSALEKGNISAAAVDVMSNEQSLVRRNSPLLSYSEKNSNLIISPHIAGLTLDSERKAAEQSIEHLKKHFDITCKTPVS